MFAQDVAPLLFLVFPPLVLIVFRLSPPWVAVSVIIVAAVGRMAALTGHGPFSLVRPYDIPGVEGAQGIHRYLNIYYLFLLTGHPDGIADQHPDVRAPPPDRPAGGSNLALPRSRVARLSSRPPPSRDSLP